MHDYEIVELLLTFSIPRRDVKPIAKQLLNTFSTIDNIIDAKPDDLCQFSYMTENSVVLMKLIRDLCSQYLLSQLEQKQILSSPLDVVNFARMEIGSHDYEAFLIFYLNTRNHLLGHEISAQGTVDHTVIYPRNIVKKALDLNANGIIIIHNHPSGDCKPSKLDLSLTTKMKDALETMSIKLLDHLIVSKYSYLSFVEENLL